MKAFALAAPAFPIEKQQIQLLYTIDHFNICN